MKKLKDFSKNEKLLIVMLVISLVLVIFSWERISTGAKKVIHYYSGNNNEQTK